MSDQVTEGPRYDAGREGTPVLGVINEDGSTEAGSLIDEIVREGARRMPAAALEAEVDRYIAESAGQRDKVGCRLAVRNGRHRPRTVTTAAGPIQVAAPPVNDMRVDEQTGERQRFSSKILAPWCRKSPEISEGYRCSICSACRQVTSCLRWSSSWARRPVCRRPR